MTNRRLALNDTAGDSKRASRTRELVALWAMRIRSSVESELMLSTRINLYPSMMMEGADLSTTIEQ